MSAQMDETFATALRELLVEQVQGTGTQHSWLGMSRRRIAGFGAVLVLAAGGSGVAYATGVFTATPGSDVVTHLSAPVTVTGTGTETVRLGPQPAGTNAIDIGFSCLAAGDFTFADGAGVSCGHDDAAQTTITYTLPIPVGQDTTTISATAGARWRLTATYSSVTASPWGINASGETYGTANQHGTPDLVAVIATNRLSGYVYANQLDSPPPETPSQAAAENNAPAKTLTVYESDGRTPIGVFLTVPGPAATQTTTVAATSTTTTAAP